MLLFVACGVNADNNEAAEWRVGGSLAYSEYERDDSLVDDSTTGFKVHAQYRFNSWIGVEGAYFDSPEFKGDATPLVSGGETETSFLGVIVDGIVYLPSPAERMDLFLKAGYFSFFDAKVTTDGVETDSGSEDGLTFGVGSAFQATDEIGIRVEFDWYGVSQADLWTIGIGAEYRF